MLNSAFDGIGATPGDYYPAALRAEIDRVNERVYTTVNNGVYRAGFATTQAAYDEAVTELFATLDWLEERLARAALSAGRPAHRGRLAPVHHAPALRPGLSRPLQVQPAPAGRLPQSVGLHARALPVAGRGRDRRLRAHQGPLLRQPCHHQPDRHRAQGPAARLQPLPTAAARSGLSPRVSWLLIPLAACEPTSDRPALSSLPAATISGIFILLM